VGQYAKDIDDIQQEVDKFDDVCLEERLQEFFGFERNLTTSDVLNFYFRQSSINQKDRLHDHAPDLK